MWLAWDVSIFLKNFSCGNCFAIVEISWKNLSYKKNLWNFVESQKIYWKGRLVKVLTNIHAEIVLEITLGSFASRYFTPLLLNSKQTSVFYCYSANHESYQMDCYATSYKRALRIWPFLKIFFKKPNSHFCYTEFPWFIFTWF